MEHDAAGRRPRVRAPAGLQGRRPARPRLGPPHRPAWRSDRPAPRRARRGQVAAALPGIRLVPGPHGEGPQAAGHGAARALLHLPDQAPPDRRHHDGRPGSGGAGRAQGLPVGAGGRDVEGRPLGRGRRRGDRPGGLGLAPMEEGPLPRLRPPPGEGEGLPHRLRRRATGRRHRAPDDAASTRWRAPGSGGCRLPALRSPGGGAIQGEQGAPRRARSLPAPRGSGTLRKAQRPGGAGSRRPVAPARSGRRDAPGGAVGREGAQPPGKRRQGRRSGGRHDRRNAAADPVSRRPAQAATHSTWRERAWESPPSCATSPSTG